MKKINLFLERIRGFFRKKFNNIRAKTAIVGIKGLINHYQKQSDKILKEMDKLYEERSKYNGMVVMYGNMLEEIREELKNESI